LIVASRSYLVSRPARSICATTPRYTTLPISTGSLTASVPLHILPRPVKAADIQVDVRLIWIPAYSPDMNPIEKLFGIMKNHLRRSGALQVAIEPKSFLMREFRLACMPDLMKALYRSCGYSV
jgi:hypothetical protein